MQQGLPVVLVENAETVGTLAVILASLLYRYFGGEWPLLSKLRRNTLPFLHEVILEPAGGYAAREQYPREHVGTYDVNLVQLHRRMRETTHFYPNNFAAIKYREYMEGTDNKVNSDIARSVTVGDKEGVVRQYESSSWVHREDGLTGDTQTHFMIYDNGNGSVDVYAHYELSPIPHPVKHYKGSEGVWSVPKGVDKAEELMASLGIPKKE